MTELLSRPVEVRCAPEGAPAEIRIGGRWHPVERVVARWVVDTDWWRAPVRRDYRRCLLGGARGASTVPGRAEDRRPPVGGDCVELCHDLVEGTWWLVRRYD